MPFCEVCERFWNPNSMPAAGTCPTCGIQLAAPQETEPEDYNAPWHFKLLVALTVAYLVWRLLQLVNVLPE